MMPAVLASDMGKIVTPLIFAAVACAPVLLLAVIAAKIISRRPWLLGFLMAAIWGLICPIGNGVMLFITSTWGVKEFVSYALVPTSAITAAVLGWASRSVLPSGAVGVGWILAGVLGGTGSSSDDARALVSWHASVSIGLLVWAVRERRRPRPVSTLCPGCGYELAGLAGRICPECGAIPPSAVRTPIS